MVDAVPMNLLTHELAHFCLAEEGASPWRVGDSFCDSRHDWWVVLGMVGGQHGFVHIMPIIPQEARIKKKKKSTRNPTWCG